MPDLDAAEVARVKDAAEEYLRRNGVVGRVTRADYVLALIRIGTVSALETAVLMGKPLSISLSQARALPPGPQAVEDVVSEVSVPAVGTVRGFMDKTRNKMTKIRAGMTKQQILQTGATTKEITRWTRSGLVKWAKPRSERSELEEGRAIRVRSAVGTRT